MSRKSLGRKWDQGLCLIGEKVEGKWEKEMSICLTEKPDLTAHHSTFQIYFLYVNVAYFHVLTELLFPLLLVGTSELLKVEFCLSHSMYDINLVIDSSLDFLTNNDALFIWNQYLF